MHLKPNLRMDCGGGGGGELESAYRRKNLKYAIGCTIVEERSSCATSPLRRRRCRTSRRRRVRLYSVLLSLYGYGL
jgi:hypothetical protein